MKLYPETNSARPVSHTNKNGKCPVGDESCIRTMQVTLVYTGIARFADLKRYPLLSAMS